MGFDSLNHDCLRNIVECVDDVSPKTIRDSLRFVSRDLNAICTLIGHRHKTIRFPPQGQTFNDARDQSKLSKWFENEDMLRGLHYLTVKNDSSGKLFQYISSQDWPHKEFAKFDHLVTLIAKLGNLRVLTWSFNGPIPLSVLDALHKYQPKAQLKVHNFSRLDQSREDLDPAEAALTKSTALVSIRARIRFEGQVGHPDLREALFKSIVTNAPRLRYVSIVKDYGAPGFHALSDEQLQEVDDLSSEFLKNARPNPSVNHLTIDGYDLNDRTLREWGQLVDLSKLKSIKCSRGLPAASYFTYAPQVLKNLKHVSLNLTTGHVSLKNLVQTYITETAPLESLSLWAWMDTIPLDLILSRHGPTLRILQLHERETIGTNGQESRKLLSSDDLDSIKASCPELRDLTFDVDRFTSTLVPDIEMSHYEDKIKTLASMNLDKLQIYYDVGLPRIACIQHNHYQDDDPFDTRSADEEAEADDDCPLIRTSTDSTVKPFITALWKRVFGHRPNGSPRELDVKFGEWERKTSGQYPPPWLLIESYKKTWWVVRPEERDDKVGECVAKHALAPDS